MLRTQETQKIMPDMQIVLIVRTSIDINFYLFSFLDKMLKKMKQFEKKNRCKTLLLQEDI